MNRRRFLQLLGLSAAGALAPDLTLDPERLLWVPGARTFFLPSEPLAPIGFNARHRFLTPDWITQEALRVLQHNNLAISKLVNRAYDEQFRVVFRHTMNMRLPHLVNGRPTVVLRPGEEFISISRGTT